MENRKFKSYLKNIMIQAADNYKKYVLKWVDGNYSYSLPDLLILHLCISDNWPDDPYNMFNKYVVELGLNNRTYLSKDEKNMFFSKVAEKVFYDIKNILFSYSQENKSDLMHNIYGSLLCNRALGLAIVRKQDKNGLIIDNSPDCFLQIIFTVMDSNKDTTREIEQYVATQEDALELLIKIVQSFDFNEKGGQNLKENSLEKLFTLSHILILITHTRQDFTIGINYDKELSADENGKISSNAFMWNNVDLNNLDYKFSEDYSEFSKSLIQQLNNEILKKLGFDFDDLEKLKNYLQSIENEQIIIEDKKTWIKIITDIGIDSSRATNLIKYFLFPTSNEVVDINSLYKLINPEYNKMFSLSIFIEFNDMFICFIIQSLYAITYFVNSAFNYPDKFIDNKSLVEKIADAFCTPVECRLQHSFKNSQSTTHYYLSKICKSNREIDVIFVIENRIYLIECKRLNFPRSDTGVINQHNQLLGKYSKQLKAEVNDFHNNQEKIMDDLTRNNLIIFDKSTQYKINGIIVTKEFSPSQIQASNSIIQVDQLVGYIKRDLETSS